MSALALELERDLNKFIEKSEFEEKGAIVTDIDGTAVNEVDGRIRINTGVEAGLRSLYSVGRPLVLNSLRFPLSVLKAFGREWYDITASPLPAVTLNGSLLGVIDRTSRGDMIFSEVAAYPLTAEEVKGVLTKAEKLIEAGLDDLLVFFYPRDWRIGEVIWTPIPERVLRVKEKYLSASSVTAVELSKLRKQMLREDVCMIYLQVDLPEDRRMAYQHTHGSNFFSRKGVTKLSGAREAARIFGFELEHSLGAGDTEMDTFLEGVGLAVIVGGLLPRFEGLLGTIKVPQPSELGELLSRLHQLIEARLQ